QVPDVLVALGAVCQPPAAALYSAQWRSRVDGIDALVEEAAPLVSRNLIEGRHDVVKRVGFHSGRSVCAAVKKAAEVVERFLSAALPAYDRVGFEPDEPAFVIKICAATLSGPFGGGVVEQLRGDRCVRQRTPFAARTFVEICGAPREPFAVLL